MVSMTTSREKRLKKYFKTIPAQPHPAPKPLAPSKMKPNNVTMSQAHIKQLMETTQQLKKFGPGKRGHIFFTQDKNKIHPDLKTGKILLLEDGLYIVDRVAMGCSAVRYASIYCSPFDPTNMPESKVLIQKN